MRLGLLQAACASSKGCDLVARAFTHSSSQFLEKTTVIADVGESRWTMGLFGPDRAFACTFDTSRIPFQRSPNGWNLTVEHEAPDDALTAMCKSWTS